MLNMLKLKKVLFNNFDGQKIYISSNGIVSLNFSIDNARIIVNLYLIINCVKYKFDAIKLK